MIKLTQSSYLIIIKYIKVINKENIITYTTII